MIKNIIKSKIIKPNIIKKYCHSHSKTVFNQTIDNKCVEKINNIEMKVDNTFVKISILQKQLIETQNLLSYLYIINIIGFPIMFFSVK